MKENKNQKRKENRKILYGLSLITQVGISMMVPLFICVALGVLIQNKTGAMVAVPIAIIIGIITSFRNVYILTGKIYEKDMDRENKELKYLDDMRKEREKNSQKKGKTS